MTAEAPISDAARKTWPVLRRLDAQGASARPIRLRWPVMLIGSKPHAHIYLSSKHVCGTHAAVVNTGDGVYLRNLSNSPGVCVNGQSVLEHRLQTGDTMSIEEFPFEFLGLDDDAAAPARSEREPAPASLLIEGDPEPVSIDGRIFLIGRRGGADLILADPQVSNAHALIVESGGRRTLFDLNSSNGTRVNRASVQSVELEDGAKIGIGSHCLRFSANAPSNTPAAAAPRADNKPAAVAASGERVRPKAPAARGAATPSSPAPANGDTVMAAVVNWRDEEDASKAQEVPPPIGLDGVLCKSWGPLAVAVANPQLTETTTAGRLSIESLAEREEQPRRQRQVMLVAAIAAAVLLCAIAGVLAFRFLHLKI